MPEFRFILLLSAVFSLPSALYTNFEMLWHLTDCIITVMWQQDIDKIAD